MTTRFHPTNDQSIYMPPATRTRPTAPRSGRRRAAAAVVLTAAATFGAAQTVSADAVYHTYTESLAPVADHPGRASVVNIHPNGPVVFAMEKYQIARAEPEATYHVVIYLHPFSPDCSQPAVDFGFLGGIPSADVVTNPAGNGHGASVKFSPAEIAAFGLNDAEHGVRWVIYDADLEPAFESECSVDVFD